MQTPANSKDCIFCAIVSNTASASIAYEDDFSIAVLDLRQFNPGHTLLIPRTHIADVRASIAHARTRFALASNFSALDLQPVDTVR